MPRVTSCLATGCDGEGIAQVAAQDGEKNESRRHRHRAGSTQRRSSRMRELVNQTCSSIDRQDRDQDHAAISFRSRPEGCSNRKNKGLRLLSLASANLMVRQRTVLLAQNDVQ